MTLQYTNPNSPYRKLDDDLLANWIAYHERMKQSGKGDDGAELDSRDMRNIERELRELNAERQRRGK